MILFYIVVKTTVIGKHTLCIYVLYSFSWIVNMVIGGPCKFLLGTSRTLDHSAKFFSKTLSFDPIFYYFSNLLGARPLSAPIPDGPPMTVVRSTQYYYTIYILYFRNSSWLVSDQCWSLLKWMSTYYVGSNI